MKIRTFETFECDAGWRTFSFLKVTTDDGVVGWSEYNQSFGSPGLTSAIEALMPALIGSNPMQIELANAVLSTKSVQSRGGVVRQAIGAIENALLDIKGKALGVPVYELFGGKVRERIPSTGRIVDPIGCAIRNWSVRRRSRPTMI
jgi:galactonate dehydratase